MHEPTGRLTVAAATVARFQGQLGETYVTGVRLNYGLTADLLPFADRPRPKPKYSQSLGPKPRCLAVAAHDRADHRLGIVGQMCVSRDRRRLQMAQERFPTTVKLSSNEITNEANECPQIVGVKSLRPAALRTRCHA
jgi:hypothetical protein